MQTGYNVKWFVFWNLHLLYTYYEPLNHAHSISGTPWRDFQNSYCHRLIGYAVFVLTISWSTTTWLVTLQSEWTLDCCRRIFATSLWQCKKTTYFCTDSTSRYLRFCITLENYSHLWCTLCNSERAFRFGRMYNISLTSTALSKPCKKQAEIGVKPAQDNIANRQTRYSMLCG
jgi:hypothetical protein